VIVDDLEIRGAIGRPAEADPELIVDSNAVLPAPVAPQGFEPIAVAAVRCTSSVQSRCEPRSAPQRPRDRHIAVHRAYDTTTRSPICGWYVGP